MNDGIGLGTTARRQASEKRNDMGGRASAKGDEGKEDTVAADWLVEQVRGSVSEGR